MYTPGFGLGERVVLSHGTLSLELLRQQHFRGIGYLRQPIPETYRNVQGYTPYGTAIVGGGRQVRWRFLFDLSLTLAEWEALYGLWAQQQNTGDPVGLLDQVWGHDGRSEFNIWIPYPPVEVDGSRGNAASPLCARQLVIHAAFEAQEV